MDGLGKDSFRVTDGGKPREVVYFGHEELPHTGAFIFIELCDPGCQAGRRGGLS